jgi:hypothetical protein
MQSKWHWPAVTTARAAAAVATLAGSRLGETSTLFIPKVPPFLVTTKVTVQPTKTRGPTTQKQCLTI